MSEHPMQSIAPDQHGTLRFRANKIVRDLLDQPGGLDMNQIAMRGYSPEDQRQFAQLIGYSVSGYGELSYVDDASYATAVKMSEGQPDPRDARIAALEGQLQDARESLRDGIARLYGLHPDDLNRWGT